MIIFTIIHQSNLLYSMSFWTIWLVHSLTILWPHRTLIYLLWHLQVLHIAWIYLLWYLQVPHIAWIYLLWWIWLICQQFVVSYSSSGQCCSAHFTSSDAAYDGFIKPQSEKFTQVNGNIIVPTQTVVKTVLKFLLLSDLSSFVYVFKLHDFCHISKKCISWCMHMLTIKASTGQMVKNRPVIFNWIKGFYEFIEWKPKASGNVKI